MGAYSTCFCEDRKQPEEQHQEKTHPGKGVAPGGVVVQGLDLDGATIQEGALEREALPCPERWGAELQPLAGEQLEGALLGMVAAAVNLDILAGAQLPMGNGGQEVVVGGQRPSPEDQGQDEVGGQEENTAQAAARAQLQPGRPVAVAPAKVADRDHSRQAEKGGQPVLGPEQVEGGQLPGQGGQEVDTVGPFDLEAVQEQMEQAVETEQQEELVRFWGQQTQGRAQE